MYVLELHGGGAGGWEAPDSALDAHSLTLKKQYREPFQLKLFREFRFTLVLELELYLVCVGSKCCLFNSINSSSIVIGCLYCHWVSVLSLGVCIVIGCLYCHWLSVLSLGVCC